ncbi:MAG TPA: 6-hydroxymethylpterin diphosphokinase MptE-like protein, partial [Bacillota bacterium]|nr:6-hydroxymethylpterin diphosphokinase MptE-like protein [Bacillota bacterium]
MILIENINILTERFPRVWQQLKALSDSTETLEKYQVVESKSKLPTLVVEQDGQKYYIHSKYNPAEEAQKFVTQFQTGKTYRHIFFYGVGLGYHVDALLAQYPGVSFTIFEPAPEILYRYLATQPLEQLPLQNLKYLATETTPNETFLFLKNYTSLLKDEVLFVTLPSYERIFKEHYTDFLKKFSSIVFYKRTGLRTDLVYQQKWALNSIKNFKYLLETPSFLESAREDFGGKPVIIAAAGPSLMDEIENLQTIKANRLAYIFSAGSGLHPLLNHGITPDAACLYDPNDNSVVYNPVIDQKIDNIPLIFGSSMGFSRFDEYPGPRFHFVINQDRVAPFYLQRSDKSDLAIIDDCPTITNVIFQLLSKLGCSPIIFVGQNLGFRGE